VKNVLAFAVVIALVGAVTFCVAGCRKSEEAAVERTVEESAEQYACPMKCEDDKTYPNAGNCPVCKMALNKVE